MKAQVRRCSYKPIVKVKEVRYETRFSDESFHTSVIRGVDDDSSMQAEGSEELRPFALRITQIYRREDGDWKIIHRHADPIMQQSEPAWFKQGQR